MNLPWVEAGFDGGVTEDPAAEMVVRLWRRFLQCLAQWTTKEWATIHSTHNGKQLLLDSPFGECGIWNCL